MDDEWLRTRNRLPKLLTSTPVTVAGIDHHLIELIDGHLKSSRDAKDAAHGLAAKIQHQADPLANLHAFWELLSDVIVQLPEHSERSMDLACALRFLPPSLSIDWPQLPGFREVWYTRYKSHLDAPLPSENEQLSKKATAELRMLLRAIGRAESNMLLYGRMVPADWGFRVIALVCQRRAAFDMLLSEVYGWMSASTVLRESNIDDPKDVRTYLYADGDRAATMEDHWDRWTAQYLEYSNGSTADGCTLSDYGRTLAGRIHTHMQGGLWDGYGGISSATGV